MSLPTAGKPPVVQSSIRSFFSAKTPKYAPPPSSSSSKDPSSVPPPVVALPPPATSPTPPPPPTTTTTTTTTTTSPVPIPPLPSTLAPESAIRPVTTPDINPLRRINALLLPVAYPEEFYKHLTESHPGGAGRYSRVITWRHPGEAEDEKVVGAVVCRLEPRRAGSPDQTLYIRSLCLLSPYRSLGLANAAVDNIIATAAADVGGDVRTVTAHVWTENEEGLAWYEARGFRRLGQPIKGYYLKLRPDSAWLVERQVSNTDASPSVSEGDARASRSIEPSVTAAAVNLPPMGSEPPRPSLPSGQSFQNRRADMEWNDLPAEMSSGLLAPPRKGAVSEPTSTASSRSSSTARKKRDRSYPAAAFSS